MAFGLWWMDTFGDTSYGRMWEKQGLPDLRPSQVSLPGPLEATIAPPPPHLLGRFVRESGENQHFSRLCHPTQVSVEVVRTPAGPSGGVVEVRATYTLAPRKGGARIACMSLFSLAPSGVPFLRTTALQKYAVVPRRARVFNQLVLWPGVKAHPGRQPDT